MGESLLWGKLLLPGFALAHFGEVYLVHLHRCLRCSSVVRSGARAVTRWGLEKEHDKDGCGEQ